MNRVAALIASLLAATLAACQAPPTPQASTPSAGIEVTSAQKRDGRGFPYGRSDGPGPYMRLMKLRASTDPKYGTTPENPICTGPVRDLGHILFLNSLRGPKGEPLEYERKGACCAFLDTRVPQGGGALDVYTVKVDGSDKAIELVVDMYRPCGMQLPVGLTQRTP
jgi:hypothetical protein